MWPIIPETGNLITDDGVVWTLEERCEYDVLAEAVSCAQTREEIAMANLKRQEFLKRLIKNQEENK